MILADYATPETNEAWPSVALLVQDSEMSERGVTSCLRKLEQMGLIKRTRVGNQHQSTLYRPNVGGELAGAHVGAAEMRGPAGAEDAPEDRQSRSGASAVSVGRSTVWVRFCPSGTRF